MPRFTLLKNVFTSGEIMPEAHGRTDKQLYATGLALCENFIPTKRGGLMRRRGTDVIMSESDLQSAVRIVPFEFSRDDYGLLIFRPYDANDAGVDGKGSIYYKRIGSPPSLVVSNIGSHFTEEFIMGLSFTQSGDVLTMVSATRRPQQLVRYSDEWVIEDVIFTNGLARPENVSVAAERTGSDSVRYAVTADYGERGESLAGYSSAVILRSQLSTTIVNGDIHLRITRNADSNFIFGLSIDQRRKYLGNTRNQRIPITFTDDAAPTFGAWFSLLASWEVVGNYWQSSFGSRRGFTIDDGDSDGVVARLAAIPFVRVYNSASANWDNRLAWDESDGATAYTIYKAEDGQPFAFVGTTTNTEFTDDNIDPDSSISPPSDVNPFDTDQDGTPDTNRHPSQVAYAFERLVMANTIEKPQTMFLSQTGDFDNFSTHTPTRDTDAIVADLVSGRINDIHHLVGVNDLLVFTAGDEWLVRGDEGRVLTPDTINARPQSRYGSVDSELLRPLVSGNSILFMQRGHRVRDLAYSWESDLYQGNELSILSEHLLTGDGYRPTSWCYAELPDDIVWITTKNADGNTRLVSLTYLKEQNIIAWARHSRDDGKQWEQVVSVREGDEDGVYFVVKSGNRYEVERMHGRQESHLPHRDGIYIGRRGTPFYSVIHTLPLDLNLQQIQTLAEYEVMMSSLSIHLRADGNSITASYQVVSDHSDEPTATFSINDMYNAAIPLSVGANYDGDINVYTEGGWGFNVRICFAVEGDGAADIRSLSYIVSVDEPPQV